MDYRKFKIDNYYIYTKKIYVTNKSELKRYLDNFYSNSHKGVFLQIINCDIFINYTHLLEVLKITIESDKRNILFAKKIEMDFLMRITNSKQISKALEIGSIKNNKKNLIIIFSKNKKDIEDSIADLDKQVLSLSSSIYKIDNNNDNEHYYNDSGNLMNLSDLDRTPYINQNIENAALLGII